MGDAEGDAAIILIQMRATWDDSKIDPEAAQAAREATLVKWAQLALQDKYQREFKACRIVKVVDPLPVRTTDMSRESFLDIDPPAEDKAKLDAAHEAEVRAAVAKLSKVQREVVEGCVFDGLTQAEQAAVMGVAQTSVWSAMQRAKKNLAVLLPDYELSK